MARQKTIAGQAMAGDGGPDDLPRTFRRQREQQEREAREREAREREARERDPRDRKLTDRAARFEPVAMAGQREPDDFGSAFRDEPQAAVVTRLQVPFFHLMWFSIKAVLAAIPALLLLGALLWVAGQVLKIYFPWILQMQILITFPGK